MAEMKAVPAKVTGSIEVLKASLNFSFDVSGTALWS
jgi:hypothetical protein